MKFIFVSNYINHHQIPFCNAMYALLGEEFAFLQTVPMEEERVRMGWQQEVDCPYLLKYYEEPERCLRLIGESAVVMFGGTDDESYIASRLAEGKPVVRCSERIYKEGQWKAISPRGLRRKYLDHTRYRNRPVYMLCAGAYVASDFHIVRAYPDKLLKWGYFPETKEYDLEKLFAAKRPGSILWAARFLGWKHPEIPLKVAAWLKDKGCSFHMDIVGGGDLQSVMEKLREQWGLEEDVTLLGYRTPDEVRRLMEHTDIFLATSDRNEGWGAVINEAMNSGCAVVADHMMGAVPFLMRHGQNGLIYRDGQAHMACDQVERLLGDRALCRRLGGAAYRTILQEWNARIAAERLTAFCVRMGFLQETDIKNDACGGDAGEGEKKLPRTGPCSYAPVIPERKMFSYLTFDGGSHGSAVV